MFQMSVCVWFGVELRSAGLENVALAEASFSVPPLSRVTSVCYYFRTGKGQLLVIASPTVSL